MKVFKPMEGMEVICETRKTRNGFNHEATLFLNGQERCHVKICYQNQPLESWEYQSVVLKAFQESGIDDATLLMINVLNAGNHLYERGRISISQDR